MYKESTLLFLIFLLSPSLLSLSAQDSLVYESGGILTPELAAYNVHFYELDLKVNPDDSTVAGTVDVHFEVVHPTNVIELALDPKMDIEHVKGIRDESSNDLQVIRQDNARSFYVYFPQTLQPGTKSSVAITYGGQPIVADNPPWDGGMVWDATPSGDPWVGVACQTIGAWIWWPNKDHPSDKADSVAIHLTMPEGLTVASNGQLRGETQQEKGWKTTSWFVSTPINNYNVTLNAAPYEIISEPYTSTSGDEMEITFWVLAEFLEEGEILFPQFADQLKFLEETVGPYPFRADKYGVAHAPYLGMEHQTLIAYGAGFENGALFGEISEFDDLHQHELAHEWWGNLVTAWDWRDFWIHEGIGTYMQALYAEHLGGKESYQEMIEHFTGRIVSSRPTAPRVSQSTLEITGGGRGGDVYFKGAAFLHTLRNYIEDEIFFEVLRRFAYPEPEMESVTDGSQVRFATTDDFLTLANKKYGGDLSWLFETYLRQASIPKLLVQRENSMLRLQWQVTGDQQFPLPVEVEIDGEKKTVEVDTTGSSIEIPENAEYTIDPDNRILKIISD